MRYLRADVVYGTCFFIVNLAERKRSLLEDHVDTLHTLLEEIRARHLFDIDAMVILLDHLQAVWNLPDDDADYPTRWALIKAGFSRRLLQDDQCNRGGTDKGDRGVWQRRCWEQLIRDERGYTKSVDYTAATIP